MGKDRGPIIELYENFQNLMGIFVRSNDALIVTV